MCAKEMTFNNVLVILDITSEDIDDFTDIKFVFVLEFVNV